MMNPFDESPSPPPDNRAPLAEGQSASDEDNSAGPSGFPETEIRNYQPLQSAFPPDLDITWSWPHFIVFLFFSFLSLVVVQGILAVHYAPHDRRLTTAQLEQYLISKPQFAIGSMLIWYAVVFFFLYVTLAVLRGQTFWRTLGWREIQRRPGELPRNPLVYLFTGCGLSVFVALITARLKPPENLPVEELFKYRQTALLFMAMAVFVAPLVEETLFRGYIYPFFARFICSILKFFGVEHSAALRGGVASSVILTGVCFGSLHGAQLGWTWSLVLVLIMVGTIFTFVRARTGTVFASYMMHLGYNSLIAATALLGTHGFTKLPTNP